MQKVKNEPKVFLHILYTYHVVGTLKSVLFNAFAKNEDSKKSIDKRAVWVIISENVIVFIIHRNRIARNYRY